MSSVIQRAADDIKDGSGRNSCKDQITTTDSASATSIRTPSVRVAFRLCHTPVSEKNENDVPIWHYTLIPPVCCLSSTARQYAEEQLLITGYQHQRQSFYGVDYICPQVENTRTLYRGFIRPTIKEVTNIQYTANRQHITVISYGEKQTGKTYSIMGKEGKKEQQRIRTAASPGLVLLTLADLLHYREELLSSSSSSSSSPSSPIECRLKLSVFCVWQNTIVDLCSGKQGLSVKYTTGDQSDDDSDNDGVEEINDADSVTISGLTEIVFNDAADALETIVRCEAKQQELRIHDAHIIISFTLLHTYDYSNMQRTQRFTFIDMAAKPIINSTTQKRSASDINEQHLRQSHLFLLRLLKTLNKKDNLTATALSSPSSVSPKSSSSSPKPIAVSSSHIPYRDCLFTQVCQPYINTNSHIFFISHLSSEIHLIPHTHRSLQTLIDYQLVQHTQRIDNKEQQQTYQPLLTSKNQMEYYQQEKLLRKQKQHQEQNPPSISTVSQPHPQSEQTEPHSIQSKSESDNKHDPQNLSEEKDASGEPAPSPSSLAAETETVTPSVPQPSTSASSPSSASLPAHDPKLKLTAQLALLNFQKISQEKVILQLKQKAELEKLQTDFQRQREQQRLVKEKEREKKVKEEEALEMKRWKQLATLLHPPPPQDMDTDKNANNMTAVDPLKLLTEAQTLSELISKVKFSLLTMLTIGVELEKWSRRSKQKPANSQDTIASTHSSSTSPTKNTTTNSASSMISPASLLSTGQKRLIVLRYDSASIGFSYTGRLGLRKVRKFVPLREVIKIYLGQNTNSFSIWNTEMKVKDRETYLILQSRSLSLITQSRTLDFVCLSNDTYILLIEAMKVACGDQVIFEDYREK